MFKRKNDRELLLLKELNTKAIKFPFFKNQRNPCQKTLLILQSPIKKTEELATLAKQQFNQLTANTPEIAPSEKTVLSLPSSSPSSEKNKNYFSRYQILRELGSGGMGVIQLVKDNFLGREVALKTARLKGGQNESSIKQRSLLWRLKQEASITSILEHPNIVPVYDVQEQEGGNIQFLMRKVEGETLRELFLKMREKTIQYHENDLLDIFIKICQAVSYAHSKGIVHRDLKPENIMVGQFGEVYVMDWGIAKKVKQDSKEDPLEHCLFNENNTDKELQEEIYKTIGGLGTRGYMSPEQQEDASQVTPQSDIFALGQILKECFFLSTIESLVTKEAEEKLEEESKKKLKYKQQVNHSVSYSGLMDYLVELLVDETKPAESVFEELKKVFKTNPTRVKPRRTYERKKEDPRQKFRQQKYEKRIPT